MTNILTKIIKANQEYEILGWGSSSAGEEHEVITQAAYDALTPAQKAEKVYMIKESGTPAPSPMPSSVDSFNRFITNQPMATYTENTTIAEENIPVWASFFWWVPEVSWTLVSWWIISLDFLKSNVWKQVALCSAYRDSYIKYENSSYTIHITGMNHKVYLF